MIPGLLVRSRVTVSRTTRRIKTALRSVDYFVRRRVPQEIADSRFGHEPLRVRGILLELAAERADLHAQVVALFDHLGTPDGEKRAMCEYAFGVGLPMIVMPIRMFHS